MRALLPTGAAWWRDQTLVCPLNCNHCSLLGWGHTILQPSEKFYKREADLCLESAARRSYCTLLQWETDERSIIYSACWICHICASYRQLFGRFPLPRLVKPLLLLYKTFVGAVVTFLKTTAAKEFSSLSVVWIRIESCKHATGQWTELLLDPGTMTQPLLSTLLHSTNWGAFEYWKQFLHTYLWKLQVKAKVNLPQSNNIPNWLVCVFIFHWWAMGLI